jgi:hypothetical protein
MNPVEHFLRGQFAVECDLHLFIPRVHAKLLNLGVAVENPRHSVRALGVFFHGDWFPLLIGASAQLHGTTYAIPAKAKRATWHLLHFFCRGESSARRADV